MEKIALFFSKRIDNNLVIYFSIKDLNIAIRYLFYIFFGVGSSICFYLLSTYILSTIGLDENLSSLIESGLIIISILIFIMTSLIITYEYLIIKKIDLKILKQKEHENKKEKKLGRLRNRIIAYSLTWFISLQIIYYLHLISIVNNGEIIEKQKVIMEMNDLTLWLTGGMILIITMIEYIIYKKGKNK